MSVFIPTTTVSIYKVESSADEYGDVHDDNTTIAASGIPAAISEGLIDSSGDRWQVKFLPASMRGTLIEYFTVRFRPGIDVEEGDRLRDERTDLWFQVNTVVRPPSIVGYADIRAGVTRIGDTSQPVNG